MRPKKRVLLCCADEDFAGELRMALAVWQFTGGSLTMLDERERLAGWDCALVVSGEDGYWLAKIEQMKQLDPGLRIVLLLRQRVQLQTLADQVVYDGCGRAMLREALRVATARKRGPKKETLPGAWVPQVEESAVA